MGLGSAIGVGLFLGSANAIHYAGPSVLLAYLLGGIVTFVVLRALGEMAVFKPTAGSIATYATKFVGPLAGYMVGWGYWTYWVVVGIAEVTAVGIYMTVWLPDTPQWVWALSSLACIGFINLITVKAFGEFEFWFAMIKIITILLLIFVGGLVIFFGYTNNWQPIGFSNLWLRGGFIPHGIRGFLIALPIVLFAYLGIEMIGLSAGEVENPDVNIPAAIGSLIWRILVFYIGAIFVILAIFPWNQVGMHGSPFVVMLERIGLRQAAGIINFVVITAALSSCNVGIYSGGRILYSLSQEGHAPRILSTLSRYGIPYWAILITTASSVIGVSLNYFVPEKAFQYIMAAVTFIGLMVWVAILYTHIKFRLSFTRVEISRLKFKLPWWPYSSYLALGFISLVIALMAFPKDSRAALIYGPTVLAVYLAIYYIAGIGNKHSKNEST